MNSPFNAACSPQGIYVSFLAQNRFSFAEKTPMSPSAFNFFAGTGIYGSSFLNISFSKKTAAEVPKNACSSSDTATELYPSLSGPRWWGIGELKRL